MLRKFICMSAMVVGMSSFTGITAYAAKPDMNAAVAAQQAEQGKQTVMRITPPGEKQAMENTEDITIEDGNTPDEDGMYDVITVTDDSKNNKKKQDKEKKARPAPVNEITEETAAPESTDAEADNDAAGVQIDNETENKNENVIETENLNTQDQPEAADAPSKEATAPQPEEVPAATNPGIDLPADVQGWCEQAAAESGIDKNPLEGLVWVESKGNVGAKNGSYIGLTQLNPRNFRDAMASLGITDPNDGLSNVRICAYSLSQWMQKYGNLNIALDCWHRGEGKAAAANRTEGTSYTRKIMEKASQYAGA